jgi:hypothetical protein
MHLSLRRMPRTTLLRRTCASCASQYSSPYSMSNSAPGEISSSETTASSGNLLGEPQNAGEYMRLP